jgi:hypothetical protein
MIAVAVEESQARVLLVDVGEYRTEPFTAAGVVEPGI